MESAEDSNDETPPSDTDDPLLQTTLRDAQTLHKKNKESEQESPKEEKEPRALIRSTLDDKQLKILDVRFLYSFIT